MAQITVGELIKEARTKAKLTQSALAEQIDGLSAADISAAERGKKELTTAQLKQIAKLTGVTQKSLLEAAAGRLTTSPVSSKKETSSSKKESSTSSSKKASTELKLTATEKKLVELYRAADSDTKKSVMSTLKGEKSTISGIFESLIGSAAGSLLSREMPAGGDESAEEDGSEN